MSKAPPRRSYHQHCPLSLTLDLVGERWTLLIVRELLLGPRRFTDLVEGLPGIATDLLTVRLRKLEDAGLARRRYLPRPASSVVYELTDRGRDLEPAVLELARWGMPLMARKPGRGEPVRASLLVLGVMRVAFRAHLARGVHDSYELRLGDEVFQVHVDDEVLTIIEGPAHEPDLTLATDAMTFIALGTRQVEPEDAIASGALEAGGDPAALDRFAKLFRVPEPGVDPEPLDDRSGAVSGQPLAT